MVLPMDFRLITNILNNLTHSNENVVKSYSHLQLSMLLMCLFHLVLCKNKIQRNFIYCNVVCLIQAQLLQFVQPTYLLICNLSLRCLPKKMNIAPCIPFPTLTSQWSLPQELLQEWKQLTKEKGDYRKICKLSTMSLTILPCTCYNFLFVIVVLDLGDYVVQVYIVFMVVWV